jgi:putative membrane protein insertion efficiency factor
MLARSGLGAGQMTRLPARRQRRRDSLLRAWPAANSMVRAPANALVLLIRGYQRWVSPLFVPRCRFYPSCSAYAVQALQVHGLVKGGRLALWRLVRCQPFSAGGVDHVPAPVVRHSGVER